MADEGGAHDTEIKIDDEDIHVGRQLQGRDPVGGRAEDRIQNDDPDRDQHALDDEGRNGPGPSRQLRDGSAPR